MANPSLDKPKLTFDALACIPNARCPIETYLNTLEPFEDVLQGYGRDRNMAAQMMEWDRKWRDVEGRKEKG